MFSESAGECDDHFDWCISCCGVRDLKTLHFCTMDCVSLSDLGTVHHLVQKFMFSADAVCSSRLTLHSVVCRM